MKKKEIRKRLRHMEDYMEEMERKVRCLDSTLFFICNLFYNIRNARRTDISYRLYILLILQSQSFKYTDFYFNTIKRWEMVFYFGKINYKRGGEVQRLPHLLIK